MLGEKISAYGELLPIKCNDQPCYIFNCLELVSLDKNLSNQTPLEHGLIAFENITFDQSKIFEKLLFKSQDESCTSIFCSEAFVSPINQSNLKGLKFSENLTDIF